MFKAGVDVVTIHAEYGAGQIEMPLAPAFGIDAADQVRIQQA
jgi:glutamine synthetase